MAGALACEHLVCMNLTEYAYPTPFSTLTQIEIQFNLRTVKLLFAFNSMHLVNLLQPYIQQPRLTIFLLFLFRPCKLCKYIHYFCYAEELMSSIQTVFEY